VCVCVFVRKMRISVHRENILLGKYKVKNHLGDICIDVRIILKWIL